MTYRIIGVAEPDFDEPGVVTEGSSTARICFYCWFALQGAVLYVLGMSLRGVIAAEGHMTCCTLENGITDSVPRAGGCLGKHVRRQAAMSAAPLSYEYQSERNYRDR